MYKDIVIFVDITQALTLAENLPSVQSALPSLRLPKMRFTKTGSCLQMNYRSRGIRLNISTDKQNLTSLSSSDEWKFIKVNIDYSTESYQVWTCQSIVQIENTLFNIMLRHVVLRAMLGNTESYLNSLCSKFKKW